MELKSKYGVEIFQAGTWNKEAYTVEDLDEMVSAFTDMQATWKPPLKLGHNEEQKLLQDDGLPAAGWIGKLYRQGEKLLADFIDIPDKIYTLLENKAYKKVSSEIFWNIEINGKLYRRMLAGVALLGSDMPAVTTLNDILALYTGRAPLKKCFANEEIQPIIKTYTQDASNIEVDEMPANQSKLTDAEIAALEVKAAKAEADAAELTSLKQFKIDAEAKAQADAQKLIDAELKVKAAELDAQVSAFTAEKLVSPAMVPFIKEIMGADKKEYSIGEKKLSKAEAIKETLKLHAEFLKLNTQEKTINGEKITQDKDLNAKIEAVAAEQKLSYGKAYAIVMKGVKDDAKKLKQEE